MLGVVPSEPKSDSYAATKIVDPAGTVTELIPPVRLKLFVPRLTVKMLNGYAPGAVITHEEIATVSPAWIFVF